MSWAAIYEANPWAIPVGIFLSVAILLGIGFLYNWIEFDVMPWLRRKFK